MSKLYTTVNHVLPIIKQNKLVFDLVDSSVALYSLNKLRASYNNNAIRVRRSSDNTELDIGFIAGHLNVQALLNFVGSGSGYISKWYDQSGNGNHALQTVASFQPKIVDSSVLCAVDGKPAIYWNSASNESLNVSYSDSLQLLDEFTFSTVIYPDNWGMNNLGCILDKNNNGSDYLFGLNSISSKFQTNLSAAAYYSDNNFITLDELQHCLLSFNKNLPTNQINFYKNGSYVSSEFKTTSINNNNTEGLTIGNNSYFNRTFGGYIAEVALMNKDKSANYSTICNYINSYYLT